MGLAFAGIEYGAHDANRFTKVNRIAVETTTTDTLNVKMLVRDNFEGRRYHNIQTVFDKNTEKFYGTNLRLDIQESNTDETYLKIHKEASGISKVKAQNLASEMVYKVETIDNNLLLDAYFLSDLVNRYRNQKVKIVLYIPKGQTIYLDKSTKNFLSDIDNIQDIYDRSMVKHHYKMINEGLDCLDCKTDDDDENKDEDEKEDNNTEDATKKVKLKIDSDGVDLQINK